MDPIIWNLFLNPMLLILIWIVYFLIYVLVASIPTFGVAFITLVNPSIFSSSTRLFGEIVNLIGIGVCFWLTTKTWVHFFV